MVVFGIVTGSRKFLAKYDKDLDIVKVSRYALAFAIPIKLEENIRLYNKSTGDYFEFNDDKIDKELLELAKKNASHKEYVLAIEDLDKRTILKKVQEERNKEQIQIKENKEFIKFIKIIGVAIAILILIAIIVGILV